MDLLVDDVWLKVFAYLDSKKLMKSRFVCRRWASLVLQHVHQELTCTIDLSRATVHSYTMQKCLVLKTPEEANKAYDETITELSQLNEFLQKHTIKRVRIKWWFDMTTPEGIYKCTKPEFYEENKRKINQFRLLSINDEEENKRRAFLNEFLQSYFEAWHPLMSELASLLRNCNYLCMFRCMLNRIFWKWLFEHCALTELYLDECFFKHCEGKFDEIHWPSTVCISATPCATLAKLKVQNSRVEPTFLQTVNSCVDSLANVRQFEYRIEEPKLDKRNLNQKMYKTIGEFFDSSLDNNVIKLNVHLATVKELIDFTDSSLPSLEEFTLRSGQNRQIRFCRDLYLWKGEYKDGTRNKTRNKRYKSKSKN